MEIELLDIGHQQTANFSRVEPPKAEERPWAVKDTGKGVFESCL